MAVKYVTVFFILLISFNFISSSVNNTNLTSLKENVSFNSTIVRNSTDPSKMDITTNILANDKFNSTKGNNSSVSVNGTTVSVNGTSVSVNRTGEGGLVTYFRQFIKSKPSIGENCTRNEDCEVRESSCVNGICRCTDDFVTAIDRWHCLKKAKSVGDQCLQDAQCYQGLNLTVGDAMCISFKCVCGTNTIYRDGSCIKSIYLGDICKSDNDCLTLNSHCLQGVCSCPMDMIPGSENRQCLPALKTMDNANCTEDEQCQHFMGDYALCTDNKCRCKATSHFSSNNCVPDLRLGESCNTHTDCITSQETEDQNHRQCIDGQCRCIAGFIEEVAEDACMNSALKLSNGYIIFYSLLMVAVSVLFK